MKKFNCKKQSGQSLVEILVVIGLLSIILPALLTGFVASREGRVQGGKRLRAVTLLQEAQEAFRCIKERTWNSMATGIYHPELFGASWRLVSGAENIDDYTRQIVISDVQRDANGAIVASGGTLDTSTKKVVITVSWADPVPGSIESTSFYTRHFGNRGWVQTTQSDFNQGTHLNTLATNNFGGEVELDQDPGGDWASPEVIATYDNEGSSDGFDVIVVDNYAYIVTDDERSNADFAIIDVLLPNTPAEIGTLDLGMDVHGVYVVGDYAYLATTDSAKEFIVLDISDRASPTEVASLDLGDRYDALDVFVSGNYAYVTKQESAKENRELYIIDVSTPTSPSEVGSFEVGANTNSVYVYGNYAYLATEDSSREFVVVDISNPSSPSEAGSYDAGAYGQDVYDVDGYVGLVVQDNTGGPEFYILDVSTPSSISLVGSYEVGANTNGLFYDNATDFAFLATDASANEFIVLDVSTPSTPLLYGSTSLDAGANRVFISGDYAYVANDVDIAELAIIEGGPGEVSITEGVFESSILDLGSEAAFNNLNFSTSEPSGTNITFQVAINNDGLVWNYFGPDGTENTYFENPGSIPLDLMHGRYFRYKADLYGTEAETPVLEEATINYSLAVGGDWTTPEELSFYDSGGAYDAIDLHIDGDYGYIGRLDGGAEADFVILDISIPTSPIEVGALDLATNVNGVHILGNYAYLASSRDTGEFIVIDISDKSNPVEATALNLGGGEDARDVYVYGDYAYVVKYAGTSDEMYILDISSPVSPNLVGFFEVGDDSNSIFISQDYAYIVTSDDNKELIVVDVSTPSSPTEVGSYDTTFRPNATDVYVLGDIVYLITELNNKGTEFYALDVSDLSNITEIGSYELGTDARGLFVDGTFAYIGTIEASKEFVVLDIADLANIAEYGSLDLNDVANRIYVSGNQAFVSSEADSQELVVIQGGLPWY